VSVRPAQPADARAIATLVRDAYAPYVERMDRQPAPMTADYEALVRAGNTYVAELDGQLAGVIVLVAAPDHLLVDNVAVEPTMQGLGVGTSLLEVAEDEAGRLGLRELRLYTNEAMVENQVYYPRRGYLETHRATADGFMRVYYRKRLG
jgi:N-acetylglutamate synthase-like GNAT family acetyltransferase